SGKFRDVEVYSGPIKVYGRELLYSIIHDITKRKQAELSLIEKRKELENKTHELEEVNAALKVLLKQRDEDKKEFEKKVIANVKKLVFPYVDKLNNSRLNDRQTIYLGIIKSNLEDVIAPFLRRLSSKYSDLTPSEIQVAGLVKDGKTTKEIAKLLNSSTDAIDFHRNNIRKKLGLRNTKTNLRSFLLSFT
ncbi:MAG TPA: LuxR C-terminal-related transcriptional regulator, partial [Ignavibacteriaceae bacterium]|nr:LuxR C-terminal-related transcriptional regulator [Ignavibacteriaceae bacterium]